MSRKAKAAVMIALVLGAAMDVMVATLPNVALGSMRGDLHASTDEGACLNIAYFMARLSFLLLSIKLTHQLGAKGLLWFAVVLFATGCLICGLTENYYAFVFGRVLQGAGGAAFYATAQAVLFTVFPHSRQGSIQALFSLAVVLGPNALPAFSGWVTYGYDWQYVFIIAGIIGVLLLPLTQYLSFHVFPPGKCVKLRWIDLLLLTIAICCLQYAMEEGPRYDWFEEPKIGWLLGVAVILLVIFLVRNTFAALARSIDFRILKIPSFALGFLVSFVSGFALFGSGLLVPRFVQLVLRYHSADVGYTLYPSSLSILAGLAISAIVIDTKKINPFACVAAGVILVITSMALVSDVTLTSGFPDLNPPMMVRGLGLGLLFVPIIFITFSELKGDQLVNGTALFNFGRQFGGTIAMAFLPTYLERQMNFHRHNLTSYLDAGNSLLNERLFNLTNGLIFRGYSPEEAPDAALGILDITVNVQSAVLAFDNAFMAIALAFIGAAPVIITIKSWLRRWEKK
ncbi:DHA2 family efflux MFS transporter permease subunit [Fulvivirgaceae bacterium BMA12]|uniref:DHA2 family efflux MFS transporter permease subunit n=1 Tax=Agaribacillus aureus TaxID=3051825 RepID=A0ABT8L9I0_9BACT|nr:DHA2 family efflux MFS transporter permease subunit [Fulvivirgaceae bacterium BMA12]